MRDYDHPTLNDAAGPADACGWCYKWIVEPGERLAVLLTLPSPPPEGLEFMDVFIGDKPVITIVPPRDTDVEMTPNDVLVILCGPRCRDALMQAMADAEARARGETVPVREPSETELRDAERVAGGVCAWCLSPIAEDQPVRSLAATLSGKGHPKGRRRRVVAIDLAGRSVFASFRNRGRRSARDGYDVDFILCSDLCAEALIAACRRDKAVRRVH